ncbi:MAG: PH domain-containing protein [Clostridia bacterium]|nr:PH domain-containing protein [Clostridia bacterium]
MEYSKVSKKSKLYISLFIFLVTIVILITLGVLNLFFQDFSTYFYYFSALVFVVYIVFISFLPNIVYSNYEYRLDQDKLISIYGIIFMNKKVVLLKNVYKIVIKMSPLGRIIGLYSLILETSAGSIKINYLDDSKIDDLFYRILRIEEGIKNV